MSGRRPVRIRLKCALRPSPEAGHCPPAHATGIDGIFCISAQEIFLVDDPTDLARRRDYHLYLVTDVDVPWVSDGQRFFSEQAQRRAMFDRFVRELTALGRPYQVVRGTWEQRLRDACDAVRALLESPPGEPLRR